MRASQQPCAGLVLNLLEELCSSALSAASFSLPLHWALSSGVEESAGERLSMTPPCTWARTDVCHMLTLRCFLAMLCHVTSLRPSHIRDHLRKACSSAPGPTSSLSPSPSPHCPPGSTLCLLLTLECWESGNSQAILSNNYFSRTRFKNVLSGEVTWR